MEKLRVRFSLGIFVLQMLFYTTLCIALSQDTIFLSGSANLELAEKIAVQLKTTIGKATVERFNDGEINIKIQENVRNKNVFLMQSTCKSQTGSVNDNVMELILMTRALKRASAKEVTAIIPYYGYARQDRKNEARVPISAAEIALLLEAAGVDRVISLDLHTGQIQGFFQKTPVDNLYGSYVMAPYFAKKNMSNPVIVSPDAGGVVRAKKFRDALKKYGVDADFAIFIKERARPGEVASAKLIGNVENRDVIVVDDICDTGGTLATVAKELKTFGAKDVYASISHPVFSNNAIEKINQSDFKEVVVLDTIPMNEKSTKITQLSVASLLAKVINRIEKGESVSAVFKN